MLTKEHLKLICTKMPTARVDLYHPLLTKAMGEAHINTPQRISAFIAQTAHESAEYKYMNEIWGPTEAQLRYDPISNLAVRLGNIKKGDGFAFRGAGPIQITGRFNFKLYGQKLGLDLENHPELARTPEIGFKLAAKYWETHDLNALADLNTQEIFDKITLKINGGYNGKFERDKYWHKAKETLGV